MQTISSSHMQPVYIPLTLADSGDSDAATIKSFLLREDIFLPTMFASMVVLIVAIRTVNSIVRSTTRERTRREIAAFIAEGSMTPEQGERLMKAGDSRSC